MKTIKVNGKQGIISRATDGAFRYHAWPTITRLAMSTMGTFVTLLM